MKKQVLVYYEIRTFPVYLPWDSFLNYVQGSLDLVESVVRLYDVGRVRDLEEDQEDGGDEEEEDQPDFSDMQDDDDDDNDCKYH